MKKSLFLEYSLKEVIMEKVSSYFGSLTFNEERMKERLPEKTFKALKKTIKEGSELDPSVADAVATSMKDWAIENGCTHYTHWFQPLTGSTAEKHEAFISQRGDGAIEEFSGKCLIKGEPDASSFPSGGLRATFEARGYTTWDPTSYAFIKDDTLCIPTAFISYSGEVLDKKTPLLRSMEALNKSAVSFLHTLGKSVKRVDAVVGAEQEYFLIDEEDYKKRRDIILTGHTLFGARSPKGQEMDDHYFGPLRDRVASFMKDLDEELWKLGIYAKTSHNEVAPCQHELAPIYEVCNIAVDHNQLIMEKMKKIAQKHGFALLLHEKPFEGLNGSGKHINWSLRTDTGENLFERSDEDSLQFLLFIVGVVKAVDEYQEMLRATVSSAGNDYRLGGNEAPPAVVSMFLGEDLSSVFDSIEKNSSFKNKGKEKLSLRVQVLPSINKDSSDRNRTSPLAFTGNKFEFRMPGSSFSCSGPVVVLNTSLSSVLDEFDCMLSKEGCSNENILKLIKKTWKEHKRIVFNGNAYSDEWKKEADERGLVNLVSSPDAFDQYGKEKNIHLFENAGIYTKEEMLSREEICHEEYSKTIHYEALTMLDIVKKDILPSCFSFISSLSDSIIKYEKVVKESETTERNLLNRVEYLVENLNGAVNVLEENLKEAESLHSSLKSHYYREEVLTRMKDVREFSDELELILPRSLWPFPTYGDILFYTK